MKRIGVGMIKKKDVVLIIIILLISIIAFGIVLLTKEEGATVVIKVNGDVYQTVPLNEDRTIIIGDETSDYNIVEIKNSYVTMTEANCPDKICVKHNRIHYSHESIVCLPHKVVVEIQGGEKNEVDMISN